MKNIIILTQSPLSERDYARFGVALLSRYFRVLVLDCTPWLKPDYWEKYSIIAYRCPEYEPVADYASLQRLIDRRNGCVAIDYLGDCSNTRLIRKYLKSQRIPRTIVQSGLLPSPDVSLTKKIGQMWRSNTLFSLLAKIIHLFGGVIFRSSPPEIVLMSGLAGENDKRLRAVKHKIWAHSFDYDIYMKYRAQAPEADRRYAVFLDEDLVHHPDYSYIKIKPVVTGEAYCASLSGFFQKFEQATGIPVVIAAHPRSRYDLHPHLWRGHEVRYGETALLVRDASLVFSHESTAVSFAVLWRKPLLFLTTRELKLSFIGPRIVCRSTLLKAPLLDVDDQHDTLDKTALFAVNEDAYARYVEQYIKRPGTPELPVWQVFAEYIQQGWMAENYIQSNGSIFYGEEKKPLQ